MTRDDALKLIPPGWVECSNSEYVQWNAGVRWVMDGCDRLGSDWIIYAIPAPKPEPRRVPCREMVVRFDDGGYGSFLASPLVDSIRNSSGGHRAVANTKWRLNFDTREWVEVLQ